MQKPTETIMLPLAAELVTVPREHNELLIGGEFQLPLKEEVIAHEGIVQTDLQTDKLYSNNNLLNNQADACNDFDILIALHKGRRYKLKNFDDDFVTNFNLVWGDVRMPLGLLLYISVTILVVVVAHALTGFGN